jgi:hypothetical protein
MCLTTTRAVPLVGLLALCVTAPARAQSEEPPIALRVEAGRPLEVVLDQRVTVKRAGQSISGTVVNAIYAYDRVVVPAGTTVLGHIVSLQDPSTFSRTRAMLAGDFTPRRHVVLEFDALVLDGARVPICTRVKTEIPNLKRTSAATPDEEPRHSGVLGRAEQEAKNQVKDGIATAKQTTRDVLAEITQPGKSERLKHELVQRLPYHPQFIEPGTGYHAELIAALDLDRRRRSNWHRPTPARPRRAFSTRG